MYHCHICGRQADLHHIIHRSEGGLDISLNYIPLCEFHHRGKNGPHKDKLVDLQYKLNLQRNLEKILKKPYYSSSELINILNSTNSSIKRLTKDLKIYKEGFSSQDILLKLMGGTLYSEETIEDFLFEKLLLIE